MLDFPAVLDYSVSEELSVGHGSPRIFYRKELIAHILTNLHSPPGVGPAPCALMLWPWLSWSVWLSTFAR